MIDFEGNNLHSIFLIDKAILIEFVDIDGDALRRQFLVCLADADVERVGLFQIGHQILSAGWPDDVKRDLSSPHRRAEPAAQPDIWNAGDVIGVIVRNEQYIDFTDGYFDLTHANGNAATSIKQQGLSADLDQGARSKSRRARCGRGGSQQRYREVAIGPCLGRHC